jgi:uncharacterized protein (TIGR03000 family)
MGGHGGGRAAPAVHAVHHHPGPFSHGGRAAPAVHAAHHHPGPFSHGGNRFTAYRYPGYRLGYGFGYSYPWFDYGYSAPVYGFYGFGVGLGPAGAAFDPYAPTFGIDGIADAVELAQNGAAAAQPGPPAPAKVQVSVPDPSAEVLFDGQKTTLKGAVRVYETPTLTPGRTYSYRVSASWTQDGRTVQEQRTVFVTAGTTTAVHFR